MRVLFLGMSAPFSQIVLERLPSSRVDIAAVLLAGEGFRPLSQGTGHGSGHIESRDTLAELPIVNPYVPFGLLDKTLGGTVAGEVGSTNAAEPGVPAGAASLVNLAESKAYECDDIGNPEVVKFMADLDIDIACVACWHRAIPSGVLGIPRHGFLNVHPSLLPAYRGPQPIFWQFRAGETSTGVTVHWMDSGLDTGDIAAQKSVSFADGIRASEAEAMCAAAGGFLLAGALDALEQGHLERRPQQSGSYFPAPSLDDFAVDTGWQVRRAFNFVRAAAEYGFPFYVEVDGERRWFRDAIAWHETEALAPASGPETEDCAGLNFQDGVLWVQECPGPKE